MADGAQRCSADWPRSAQEDPLPNFNALSICGARTMINWPTASVIAVALT